MAAFYSNAFYNYLCRNSWLVLEQLFNKILSFPKTKCLDF